MAPHIKMIWEILLRQVNYHFFLLDEEHPLVDIYLAKKIGNPFFENSGDNIKFQKMTEEYKHPANLLSLNLPKFNPEIERSQQNKKKPPL